jgi:hypothetical protein
MKNWLASTSQDRATKFKCSTKTVWFKVHSENQWCWRREWAGSIWATSRMNRKKATKIHHSESALSRLRMLKCTNWLANIWSMMILRISWWVLHLSEWITVHRSTVPPKSTRRTKQFPGRRPTHEGDQEVNDWRRLTVKNKWSTTINKKPISTSKTLMLLISPASQMLTSLKTTRLLPKTPQKWVPQKC